MLNINQEIGMRIRNFRKRKNMTLLELSAKICKSKATLSKYERGEIVIDISTLYELQISLASMSTNCSLSPIE